MATQRVDPLREIGDSDEIQIETRHDAKSPLHSTTIWIVPTEHGVYIRSGYGKKSRWYREVLANPVVAVRAGRRKATARVALERNTAIIREVVATYQKKYADRWPEATDEMSDPRLPTLRLTPVTSPPTHS